MSKRTWIVGLIGVVGLAALALTWRLPRLSPGRLSGMLYRAMSRHPDDDVPDLVLADRIRSSIGPLEQQLDLPHIHVMVHDHIATLHGDVSVNSDAERLSAAVKAVSGVRGVESYLHIGLLPSDTRPSEGRAVRTASAAITKLLAAAREAGADDAPLFAVHAVLRAFLDLVPPDERTHVFAHLPHDVRTILTTPQRIGEHRTRVRSVDEFAAVVAASDPQLDTRKASAATIAVLRVLYELVPEERDDIAAVLPRELRDMWHGLRSPALA